MIGVDLSPDSLHVAAQRAKLDQVEERIQFVCSPLETISFAENTFDLVWCEAALHHLTAELELILEKARYWTKPNGLMIIAEPINHVRWVRSLRLRMPVALNGTPQERPLTHPETKRIEQFLLRPQSRYFRLLTRMERVLFEKVCREYGPSWRRGLDRLALRIDQILTKLPGLQHCSSMVVIYGQPNKTFPSVQNSETGEQDLPPCALPVVRRIFL